MTQEEINDKIADCQKRLDDYSTQLETLSKQEDIIDEATQAQFDDILKEIELITSEIESLLDLL